MNKSFLAATVLGFLGTTASNVVLAQSGDASTYCKPGFYVGGQLGRGDTFYHNHDVLTEAAGDSQLNEGGSLVNEKTDDIGLAGRLYAGYQFNPYFAMETGYTRFPKTDFSASNTASSPNTVYKGDITQSAIDLVGKVTLPLENGFGLYAKAGLSYFTAERSINDIQNYTTIVNKTYQGVKPTYGVGIDYTIPQTSLDVDAFYTRTESHNAIKPTTFWGLGVAYKFA